MRKVIITRYQTEPTSNQRASEALVEFYRHREAWVNITPFGVVSCLLTNATPEAIFNKLIHVNIGNHFTVVELNNNDEPIKILTSFNGTTTIAGPNAGFNNTALDEGRTKVELQAELDALLDKIQQFGRDRLTQQEKQRLEHLSNLN